jgi:hypothetical protein
MPLLFIGPFARAEVDADCPEFRGTTLLGCVTIHVRSSSDLDVNETGGHDRGFQFCLKPRTGNSAGPQIDLLFRVLRHSGTHQDIPDLEASRRLEHASHLLQGREFVRHQVEDAIGDDHIGPAIRDG